MNSWHTARVQTQDSSTRRCKCSHQTYHPDAHFIIVCKTGSSKHKKQHAVGCGYIHIEVNGHQLTVKCTAGVRTDLCNQFLGARNGKPPWLWKAFVCTVREIDCRDVVSSGILADEFPYNHPHEWTKQALITLEEATEVYIVEVIPKFHS